MERKEKKWWGWGRIRDTPLEERPNFWPYLWERLGEEDIIRLVRLSVENRWALVPYGGGTRVVGGWEYPGAQIEGDQGLPFICKMWLVPIGH